MKTTNYDLFKFIPSNRPRNNGNVNRIKESMQKLGFLDSRPVIVTQDFLIIDGQHRFWAAKELGIPVTYAIETIDPLTAMIELNRNQDIWRLNEYINHFANAGSKCYQELVNFDNTYKLGPSASIIVCAGTNAMQTIKSGADFEVNDKRNEIAEFVLNAAIVLPFAKRTEFVRAATTLFKIASKKDCDKVLKNIAIIKEQVRKTGYLIIFENIINKGKPTNSRISLTSN